MSHYSLVIICALVRRFTDEIENNTRSEQLFAILSCIRIKGEVAIE